MKKINLHQLKNIKQCKFKAYISQFDFKTLNNKSAMLRKVYKNIIQEYDFINLTELELKNAISEKLENAYFLTKQEKEVEILIILKHLLRYIEYEKQLHRKIIAKNVYGTVQVIDKEIQLNADIVFENDNNIEVVKYKTSATKLSYKARTEKNLPENDIELYLLKQLGEKLYSQYNKPVVASFYHLKGKNDDKDIYKQFLEDNDVLVSRVAELESIMGLDKKEQKVVDKQIKELKDVLHFNNSVGNNIITYDYSKDLSGEVTSLADVELDFNSEKCISSDCEFCNYSTLCNHNFSNKSEPEEIEELHKSNGAVRLTKAQEEVIDIEHGNYRINAVAGAGKSTVMVMRTIELFKKGYKPSDILMITFTNKGCEELKEKIKYWLNYYKIEDVDIKDLNIFTFNSFGDSIISKEWQTLGFDNKPKLATTIDINDNIKELLIEYDKIEWLNYKNPLMNYPNAKGAFKQLLIYFNLIKSFNYGESGLINEVLIKEKGLNTIEKATDKSKLIFEMYNKFNTKLKENSLLQYQDQILYLIELFEKHAGLVNTYGYNHIIVDEYQDTDSMQVRLLKILNQYKDFKSLMVVGDDAQAIYSFRNTTPENIIKFHEEFEDVKDKFLLDNFRSSPQICNVANELSKLNTKRIDKDIISKKTDEKTPQLLSFKTTEDECKHIANLIEGQINKGVPKHEICYIARTKKELLEMQGYLNEKNIPNVVEASELYLDNTNVQCIINLANFFKNIEQDYYLMEYLAFSNNGFSNLAVEDYKNMIEDVKNITITDFNELDSEDDKEELKIEYFNNVIDDIIESDIIAKSFMKNVNKKTFHSFNQFLTYLQKIMLYKDDTSIEKDDTKYEAVILTTAHSSKGKEWSVVINSINSYKYEGLSLSPLEEERRLLFVSITRAKDELYITYNTNENKMRNRGKYSLFADELEGVERVDN